MRDLIYAIANNTEALSMGERLVGGLLVTVFSVLMVFAVLLLLMYVIKGFGLAFADKRPKPEAVKIQEAEEKAGQAIPKADEGEVLAAIIAAIASMKTGQDSKIVIRQVVKNQSTWADAGLLEQINSRL